MAPGHPRHQVHGRRSAATASAAQFPDEIGKRLIALLKEQPHGLDHNAGACWARDL